MRPAEELSLDIGWGRLAALAWPNPGKPRALCLHGWMDNAASFEPLARQLDHLDLVALEFAGHGHSDHRPPGAQYHHANNVYDVDAALIALGWDRCGLIGHSLGAGIASTLACASPGTVDWLVMIDGLGMLSEPADHVAERMRKSIESVRRPKQHRRVYESVADAARTRRTNNPMEEASSLLLVERALREEADGFRWRTDGRLLWTSPIWAVEEQALSVLRGIRCPTLAVTTEAMRQYYGAHLEGRLEAIEHLTHAPVAGRHHVHLDDAASVAAAINSFMQDQGITHA